MSRLTKADKQALAEAGDERFETSLDQLMNFIVIETMCLWLSGGLEKLKEEQSKWHGQRKKSIR